MRSKWKVIHSETGITLIEIIASVAILSLIVITFLPMFTQSMRTTKSSSDMMDATYLAQSTMEEVYHVSTSYPFTEAADQLDDMAFMGTENEWSRFVQYKEGAFIELSLKKPENGLSNVVTKIYSDDTKSKLKAQMETIYRWE